MIGIRYNLVVQDKVTSITNYGMKTEWDGSVLRAQCHKAPWKPEHTETPHLGCTCGFYSFLRIDFMDGLVDWIAHSAITVLVEAYGKIIVCSKGFRAEYMKPSYVVWPLEIGENRGVATQVGNTVFTNWEHFTDFVPDMDLAIKATKILNIPLINPDDAKYLLIQ